MHCVLKMKNTIQPYAWGSRNALAGLLGQKQPSDGPQAELWMGAHPKAPSKVYFDEQWQDLDKVIRDDPVAILGEEISRHYSRQLPYLFKVLAADQPLSIQAHPSKEQAKHGFERENEQGIPLSAGHRNYKDSNHKPECICALTLFWGMCGFRPVDDMLRLLGMVWPPANTGDLDRFGLAPPNPTIQQFFKFLMSMGPEERKQLVRHITVAASPLANLHAEFEWVVRLNRHYPGDIGVLAPILLNLFCLEPEQALFLPAGQLHAYLDGMGIEIMANSDNVLRGGLTPKHVDSAELLNILDFQPRALEILTAEGTGIGEYHYPSKVGEFVLSRLQVENRQPYASRTSKIPTPHILLCTQGEAFVQWNEGRSDMALPQGQSALVPASLSGYTITGNATLYRASVNHNVL